VKRLEAKLFYLIGSTQTSTRDASFGWHTFSNKLSYKWVSIQTHYASMIPIFYPGVPTLMYFVVKQKIHLLARQTIYIERIRCSTSILDRGTDSSGCDGWLRVYFPVEYKLLVLAILMLHSFT